MKLSPTLDRVAIRRDASQTKTKGGIILPDQAKKESNFGVVVGIGPGGFNQDGSRRPMSVKLKDKVFFYDNHETETGNGIVIVDEEDILAIARE